jgi:hypothetical protein
MKTSHDNESRLFVSDIFGAMCRLGAAIRHRRHLVVPECSSPKALMDHAQCFPKQARGQVSEAIMELDRLRLLGREFSFSSLIYRRLKCSSNFTLGEVFILEARQGSSGKALVATDIFFNSGQG